ncbi:MAG: hypothetical protein LVO36_00965, partial [Nitrosopumilus sp. (ex Thoosa mismalolli)]|nr:hypothetical protein [Nitrosopumilus sp. (ex Thoosa mismalolli)]
SEKGNDRMFFAKSNDYGKVFSEPKSLLEEEQSFFRPSSIHQVNDVVYVFGSHWSRETQQNNIVFLKSHDFGDTFSEPTILFNHEQSDQEIRVQVYGDTIYILSDDRNDFDEKGSLYLRKILHDGTLTDLVNVNRGETTVTYPQFAVSGENVYVSWRDRVNEKGNYGITERWYQVFTKSHGYCDEGLTYSPSLHVCLGNDSSIQHAPLKDPPRTVPTEPEPEHNPIPEGDYVDKNMYVYSIHEAGFYLNYTLGTPYLPEGEELEKIKISSDKRKATIYYSNGLEVKHNPMGINFNNTHYKLNPEQEEGKVFYDFRGTFAEGYEIDEPNRPHYSAITI